MHCLNIKNNRGFTIPELIISMSVFAILISLIVINLLNFQRTTSLSTVVDTLVTDIKSQQTKAMTGDTEGRSTADNYGIYFGTDRYILFHGTSYSPSDTANFTVLLDTNQEFMNILFPSSTLLFANGSGEIIGFTAGSNKVTLRDGENGKEKTMEINKYGVITQIN